MLHKNIRIIKRGTVETKHNEVFSGSLQVDRRMNVRIGNTLIKGSDIRYIIIEVADLLRDKREGLDVISGDVVSGGVVDG